MTESIKHVINKRAFLFRSSINCIAWFRQDVKNGRGYSNLFCRRLLLRQRVLKISPSQRIDWTDCWIHGSPRWLCGRDYLSHYRDCTLCGWHCSKCGKQYFAKQPRLFQERSGLFCGRSQDICLLLQMIRALSGRS